MRVKLTCSGLWLDHNGESLRREGSSGEVIPDKHVTIGWSPTCGVTHMQTVDEEESPGCRNRLIQREWVLLKSKKGLVERSKSLSFWLSRDVSLEPVECLLQQFFEYAFINHGSETASPVSISHGRKRLCATYP
jgi:hypothetical protein